ncbi:MAG: four helix bundle protein [Bacteroidales bacterium]|nr:four helix bundle protein [Bacteroidales bacterium]
MATIENFEDIVVWQKARELDKEIFLLMKDSIAYLKDFALVDQTKRSCGSIMDNIAEGFERGGNKEFIQFLYISKGSSGELRSQLYRALDRGYINKDTFNKLYSQTKEISKLLSGFIKYLKESDMKGEKFKKSLNLKL